MMNWEYDVLSPTHITWNENPYYVTFNMEAPGWSNVSFRIGGAEFRFLPHNWTYANA